MRSTADGYGTRVGMDEGWRVSWEWEVCEKPKEGRPKWSRVHRGHEPVPKNRTSLHRGRIRGEGGGKMRSRESCGV